MLMMVVLTFILLMTTIMAVPKIAPKTSMSGMSHGVSGQGWQIPSNRKCVPGLHWLHLGAKQVHPERFLASAKYNWQMSLFILPAACRSMTIFLVSGYSPSSLGSLGPSRSIPISSEHSSLKLSTWLSGRNMSSNSHACGSTLFSVPGTKETTVGKVQCTRLHTRSCFPETISRCK